MIHSSRYSVSFFKMTHMATLDVLLDGAYTFTGGLRFIFCCSNSDSDSVIRSARSLFQMTSKKVTATMRIRMRTPMMNVCQSRHYSDVRASLRLGLGRGTPAGNNYAVHATTELVTPRNSYPHYGFE